MAVRAIRQSPFIEYVFDTIRIVSQMRYKNNTSGISSGISSETSRKEVPRCPEQPEFL
jgi:hypothetical protein